MGCQGRLRMLEHSDKVMTGKWSVVRPAGEHRGRDPSDRVLTIFTSCFDRQRGSPIECDHGQGVPTWYFHSNSRIVQEK